MPKVGRPSIEFTPELEQEIVDRIVSGESISEILKDVGISPRTFYRRKANDSDFGATIAHAQEEAQEAFVDSIESLIPTIDADNYNAVKTQMWARMWVAGKRKPKRYGDKVEQFISGPDGGPIQAAITVEFVKPNPQS